MPVKHDQWPDQNTSHEHQCRTKMKGDFKIDLPGPGSPEKPEKGRKMSVHQLTLLETV